MNICCICHEIYTSPIVIIKHVNDQSLDVSRKRGHYFHKQCMEIWKKNTPEAICPLDRDLVLKMYTVPLYQVTGFNMDEYDNDFLVVIKQIKVTDKVLESLENLESIDKNGRTLAYYACRFGNYSLVCKLLLKDVNFNSSFGHGGFTPLMVAVCYNSYKIIQKLLSCKKVLENINVHDKTGKTAFGYACYYGYSKIISEFLFTKLIEKHEVVHNLELYRNKYIEDALYGKDIIDEMLYYTKIISPVPKEI